MNFSVIIPISKLRTQHYSTTFLPMKKLPTSRKTFSKPEYPENPSSLMRRQSRNLKTSGRLYKAPKAQESFFHFAITRIIHPSILSNGMALFGYIITVERDGEKERERWEGISLHYPAWPPIYPSSVARNSVCRNGSDMETGENTGEHTSTTRIFRRV